MSRGGRVFSPRGSFRGRGESSWDTRGSRGRGTFSGPSRGRYNWFKENSSSSHFDSRRYSGSSSGERYATRGRGEDTGYRRYGRTDVPSYSSRDRSHHRSPESSHKRMRTDSYGSQASSSRRSHEGNYGSGNDYNNRYSYSEDKGSGYSEERGRYRDERRSSGGGGFRDRSREDYSHRKPDHLSMPPPSARHLPSTRPRGTFRGRFSFRGTRGYTRISLARRTDALLARKRAIADSYVIRKRILTAKIQADSLKRLKIQKLRRMKEAALIKKAEKLQKALKATEEGMSEEDGKEEDDDDEEEEEEEDDGEEKEKVDDEELEEGETVEKKEKTKAKKVKPAKKKKEKVPVEEREEGEEVDDEEEEEDLDEDEDLDKEDDDDLKNESGVQITIKHDSDKRDVSEDLRRWQPGFRRQFIKLSCPHCYYRCVTFKEYSMHLYSPKHVGAMRRLSLHHKQRLVCMRLTQRQKQRVLEESEADEGLLTSRTNFCHICKLNYRQQKVDHMMSESHQSMKKFLLPYCRVCRITYKSPMLYENHACSLDHIKRKARMEERVMRLKNEENGSGSDMDGNEKEVDLENFMILDSVGDADADENAEEGSDDKEKTEGDDAEKKKEVNLGSEFVRKLEVLFCELCNIYLPRLDNQDRAMAIHCRNRGHLQRYVHYRDDRSLRKKAESLHRKEAERAEAKKISDDKKKEEEATKNDENAKEVKTDTESAKDADTENKKVAALTNDKKSVDLVSDETLWADVDNLLVLADRDDAHENKSSDEDEEGGDRGRYDRFGTSSKKTALLAPSSEADSVVLEPEVSSVKDEPSSEAEGTEKMDVADTEEVAPSETPVSTAAE